MKLKSTLVVAAGIALGLLLASQKMTVPLDKFMLLYLALGVGCSGSAQALNALVDWRIDKIEHPHRAIPLGRIKPRRLYYYMCAMSMAVLFAYPLGFKVFVLALAGLFIGLIYSIPPLYLGRRWQTSYLLLSLGYVSIPMFAGWLAIRELNPLIVETTAYFTLIALVIAPLRDCCDVKGDSLYGKKSLPVKLGINKTLKLVLFLASAVSLLYLLHNPAISSYLLYVILFSLPLLVYIMKNPAGKKNFTLLEGYSSITVLGFGVWWLMC